MSKHDQKKLSPSDRKALDLLMKAQQESEQYKLLAELAELAAATPNQPPVPTWDSPLTLVIKHR